MVPQVPADQAPGDGVELGALTSPASFPSLFCLPYLHITVSYNQLLSKLLELRTTALMTLQNVPIWLG